LPRERVERQVGQPFDGESNLITLAPLPGQRLRSSRANRIDEMLSREPSPEDRGKPSLEMHKIDLGDPQPALRMLAVHAEALRRQLETVQADRENLRFQVNLFQKDAREKQPEQLRQRVALLEVENQSARAVDHEHEQLQVRLAETERELTALDAGTIAEEEESLPMAADDPAAEDVLDEVRWENRLLEKRLQRLKQYTGQLHEGVLRARLQSARRQRGDFIVGGGEVAIPTGDGGEVQPQHLERLASDNEVRLQQLRCELRDTATAMARNRGQPPSSPPRLGASRPSGADNEGVVDVLVLGDASSGSGARDVEWHVT